MTRSNRLRASLAELTFAIWAIALPLVLNYRILNSDGDLARHLVMGEHILRKGFLFGDVFSHTAAGRPFLAYEWLSQVIYTLVHRAAGLAGVTAFSSLLLACVYALVVRYLLRRGVDPFLAYVTGIATAVLGSAHWSARPHLFTFLLLALLLPLLDAGRLRRTAVLLPLFAVWANLHPGFVFGLALIATWLAGDVLEALTAVGERRPWWRRARYHVLCLGMAVAGTLLNPHALALHAHIASHLGDRLMLAVTDEFMSPDFHGTHGRVFLLILLAVLCSLALLKPRPRFPTLLALLMTIAAALYARRNIPLFGLVGLPLIGLHVSAWWSGIEWRPLAHVRKVFREGERDARAGRLAPLAAAAIVVLGLAHGRIAGVQLVPDRFDAATFPVAAARAAREAGVEGRLFNEFSWGGYVLYSWPEQRIFIDGMTDFFGPALLADYLRITQLEPGWDRLLNDYRISLALLPPGTPLAHALMDKGWAVRFEDPVAVLLSRSDRNSSASGARNSGTL